MQLVLRFTLLSRGFESCENAKIDYNKANSYATAILPHLATTQATIDDHSGPRSSQSDFPFSTISILLEFDSNIAGSSSAGAETIESSCIVVSADSRDK